jgi:hypothetical protein
MYISFDKFIYKKIVDMCIEFFRLYGQQVPGHEGLRISWRLGRQFQVILDFCQSCEALPEYYRNPPLHKWNMSETKGQLHIHPRLANKFVMRLMNEIKRQQAEHTLTETEFKEMLGDEYLI